MTVVDANVLLYAHNSHARLHPAARTWLEAALSGNEAIGFAWSVVSAFVRIATNPRAFERPLTLAEATAIVDSWFASTAAVTIAPGPEHWAIFRRLLLAGDAKGNLVGDAHLAAQALEHGATLLSSDRDFARFPGVRFRVFPFD